MKKSFYLTGALMLIAGIASAQTKTVGATGADFTTVTAALAFFNPDPDTGAANVINIIDSGVYDEVFNVTVPVKIEGTGSSRPVLTAKLNSGGDADDGFRIALTAVGTVELHDLIIIPSATAPPTGTNGDLLRTSGDGLNLIMDNVVITANNGSNVPLTTTGLPPEVTDFTGVIPISDDGAFITATNSTFTVTNCVFSDAGMGAVTVLGPEGAIFSGAGSTIEIGEGNVFSYNRRLGIQVGASATYHMTASTDRTIILGNKGFAGIWFAAAQTVECVLDGLTIVNHTAGWGIESQNRGAIPRTFKNMVIANNTGEGIIIGEVGTSNTIIENVTIANNTAEAIQINVAAGAGTAQGDTIVTDSIIAGNGTATTQEIAHNGVGNLTISNSAIVTSGPFALTTATPSGTGPKSTTDIINDDPEFVETVDFLSADFYDVESSAFFEAGSTGTNLGGGADFVGSAPPAQLNSVNWPLYN